MPTPICAKAVLLLCLASVARGQIEVRDEPGRLVLRNEQSTIVLDKEANGAIVSLVAGGTDSLPIGVPAGTGGGGRCWCVPLAASPP